MTKWLQVAAVLLSFVVQVQTLSIKQWTPRNQFEPQKTEG